MSKCRGCRELFRSVQAIKLFKDSVCKKLFIPEFVHSPTHQFEQDGIDSSAAPRPGASSQNSSLVHGLGYIDIIDDLILLDSEYFLTALTESTDTGLAYPTNLDLQTESSWFHQIEEPFYDITYGAPSHFTEQPSPQRILYGDVPVQLLHEQRTAMYGTDETVSALLPSPQPNYEGLALLNCYTSGSPGIMLQSTFDWPDQIPPLHYQHLTSVVCPTIDSGAPYERFVECEQVAEGDHHFQTSAELQYNSLCIPQVPSTQARRLGWCAITNMVRACKIFLSKIRSRMGLKRKCKEDDDYDHGVRHKKSRPGKFVRECRLSRWVHGKNAGKVWLGSFSTKEEADRAYDVGRMFCSKRAKGFHFPASEGILSTLKDVILNLPLPDRKKAIQDVANDYGNTGCINGCTRKYWFPDIIPIPMEFRSR